MYVNYYLIKTLEYLRSAISKEFIDNPKLKQDLIQTIVNFIISQRLISSKNKYLKYKNKYIELKIMKNTN